MTKETNIAILDMYAGFPNEGMRCIKTLCGQFLKGDYIKGRYQIFDVRGKSELPDLHSFDIYISTGGPGSPLCTGEPWEVKYFNFMDALADYNIQNENKKHIFLICHSFQLLIQHWQLADVTKRKSTSFGVMPIQKTNEGLQEWLFENLENPFWAVDSRDYQAVNPDYQQFERRNAQILALEKERPHIPLERAIMAVRFSEEMIGVQFHPEADAEGMKRYFEQSEKRNAVISEYGEEKYFTMLDQLDDPDKIMLTESVILPEFLERAHAQIHTLLTV